MHPLTRKHKKALIEAASDGKLWDLWYTYVPSEANIQHYLETAMSQKKQGTAFPFVVVDNATNQVIGSTRFLNADPVNRRVEIGSTWYGKSYQRTGVNRECKYLLLKHAFEVLNCIAVEFRTDWFNLASRTAISKLGAKQDGILRNHRINEDGSFRDTVVFSITQSEWAGVKKSLRQGMA